MISTYECIPLYVGNGAEWHDIKKSLDLAFEGKCSLFPTLKKKSKKHVGKPGSLLEIRTSGTLGNPKTIYLSKSALIASYKMTEEIFGKQKNIQWLLALLPHKIAGMQVLIRSYLSNATPIIMSSLQNFTPNKFCAAVKKMKNGYHRRISLVPTQLHRLLKDVNSIEMLKTFDVILVGGSFVNEQDKIKARFHKLKIFYTYGMTETCGGCIYNRKPLRGVSISISQDGHILISGPMLANNVDKILKTSDKGSISSSGLLNIYGRSEDIINSGGIKISAHLVAEKIKLLPQVKDVCVLGINDKEWGQVLCAFVQGNIEEQKILKITKTLGKFAVPKYIIYVKKIPYLLNGKPDRQQLINCYT